MKRLRLRHLTPLVAAGSALLTIGGLVATWQASWGILTVGVGLVITTAGLVRLELGPPTRFYDVWEPALVRAAMKSAPANATIKICQTWFPDLEGFVPFLRSLLVEEGKELSLHVLLVGSSAPGSGDCDVLGARVACRPESREEAAARVSGTISQLVAMKEEVDAEWERRGRRLNLEIRQYDFLPFGPIYSIDGERMFVGFYLNYCSSEHAPMLELVRDSSAKRHFSEHFQRGWSCARQVFPQPVRLSERRLDLA